MMCSSHISKKDHDTNARTCKSRQTVAEVAVDLVSACAAVTARVRQTLVHLKLTLPTREARRTQTLEVSTAFLFMIESRRQCTL